MITGIPRVIQESTTEPITIEEAGFNLRADDDGNSPPTYIEADLIARLIKTARTVSEQTVEQSLVVKTLELSLPCLTITQLPWGPVRQIVSVNYVDSDGVDQVLPSSDYKFTQVNSRTLLVPAYGVTWPTARYDFDSVQVRYLVGYPSDDSPPQQVPEPIRMAMHLLIAHFYENREATTSGRVELPLGVQRLLGNYRLNMGV